MGETRLGSDLANVLTRMSNWLEFFTVGEESYPGMEPSRSRNAPSDSLVFRDSTRMHVH